jgi:hypothetical protein
MIFLLFFCFNVHIARGSVLFTLQCSAFLFRPKRQGLFNILQKKIPVFLPQKVKQMPTARFVEVLFLCLIKECTIWSNIYKHKKYLQTGESSQNVENFFLPKYSKTEEKVLAIEDTLAFIR